MNNNKNVVVEFLMNWIFITLHLLSYYCVKYFPSCQLEKWAGRGEVIEKTILCGEAQWYVWYGLVLHHNSRDVKFVCFSLNVMLYHPSYIHIFINSSFLKNLTTHYCGQLIHTIYFQSSCCTFFFTINFTINIFSFLFSLS